ncbi:MAG: hypothetical protein ACK4K1_08970 [Flavobacterium sp.]
MDRCKIKLVIFWFISFTTSFALSQTYTFSHKTVTKVKFIGKTTWEEQIVFSNTGKNYLMRLVNYQNTFQVSVRDYDAMKHHSFHLEIDSLINDSVFKYIRVINISDKKLFKYKNLPKKISHEEAENGERKIIIEVFKNKKQTKRFRKWELIYVPVEQEIYTWWHFNERFKVQPHYQFEIPVQILRGKIYEGDNIEPFEFELQSIKEVSLKVTVPEK